MKFFSFYIYLIEKIRILHNHLLYSFLSFFLSIFKVNRLEVFSDSNGWFFTFRYLNKIYKIRWFLSFFRYGFSYKELRVNINALVNRSGSKFTPNIKINSFFISQDYIVDSQNFNEYVASINNSKEKIDFFVSVITLIQELHDFGFCHGDLKTKNILIDCDGNPFFIDLEFLSSNKSYSEEKDYMKFFESAFFWLNSEELFSLAYKSPLNKKTKNIILNKYFVGEDIVSILRGENFIFFEDDLDEEGKDIDAYVEKHEDLIKILFLLRQHNYKFSVHYCFCDDIKIYINSRNRIIVLDVHLKQRISFWFLCYKKIFINKVVCIYLTGPDGVGKTTLINDLHLKDCHNMLHLLNVEYAHANRLFQKEIFNSFWLRRICSFLSRMVFLGVVIKKFTILLMKFKGKSKLIIFDRSLLDSMIQKNKVNRVNSFFVFFLIKKDFIVLMHDLPENINSRKPELSENEIKAYYDGFFSCGKIDYMVRVEGFSQTAYKMNSIVKFKIMKDLFK